MGARIQTIASMQYQATSKAQANARILRRAMTDAECRLWSRIRDEQLGVKFRRQHPTGPYIADFACLSPKLVLELDGSQHQHQDQKIYDSQRDAFFRQQGFDVLRFSSNAPFINLEGVLQVIASRLAELMVAAPIPAFPQRGKESIPGASS